MESLFFTKSGAFVNWVKVPYYSFAAMGTSAFRLTFEHILPHFFSKENSAKIKFQAKKLKAYEAHFEKRIESNINYYKFRNYLIQPTLNLPKLRVVKEERDLLKAEEQAKKIKDSLHEVIKEATHDELTALAKKQSICINQCSQKLRELVSQSLITKLPEKIDLVNTQFGGVCGMLVAQFAAERMKGKSWREIAHKARKGASAKTAGLQILYEALDFENRYEFASTFHKVYSEPLKAINKKNSNSKNVQNIALLGPGIYRVSFKTSQARHGLLLSKEDGTAYIIDPNIGLLSCPEHKTEKLLKQVLSDYETVERQPLFKRLYNYFTKEKESSIDLKAFEFKLAPSKTAGLRKALDLDNL